jgi:hypothetical protein
MLGPTRHPGSLTPTPQTFVVTAPDRTTAKDQLRRRHPDLCAVVAADAPAAASGHAVRHLSKHSLSLLFNLVGFVVRR